ncbi:MAG: hypothetical protein K0R28_6293, partial [Paenibacillus sp.]|nr:hypothetical protein [Paenibacillus sp.]
RSDMLLTDHCMTDMAGLEPANAYKTCYNEDNHVSGGVIA